MRAWFVTSTTQPDVRLDGPYASKDEADAACLKRTDPTTAVRHLAAGRLPCYYVARQFEIGPTMEVLHLYSAESAPPATPAAAPSKGLLPSLVYAYQKTELLALCRALELPPPPANTDRRAILIHMERELHALTKGVPKEI